MRSPPSPTHTVVSRACSPPSASRRGYRARLLRLSRNLHPAVRVFDPARLGRPALCDLLVVPLGGLGVARPVPLPARRGGIVADERGNLVDALKPVAGGRGDVVGAVRAAARPG